jgi:hypothetical protein
VLTQLFEDGQWHPIAYWSRQLKGAEVRYETHGTEMLAIFAAFKHWRQYLEGSRHPIRVVTDHSNLRSFMNTKGLSRRQARWAEALSAFDFDIEYRPGLKNPADAPSRRPDYMERVEGETMLPTLMEKLRRGTFMKDKNNQPFKKHNCLRTNWREIRKERKGLLLLTKRNPTVPNGRMPL